MTADIDIDSGHLAPATAGLLDAGLARARPGEDAKRIKCADGTILLEQSASPATARPGVYRGELRALLLNALPTGAVRWGHEVVAVVAGERLVMQFADGRRLAAGLVIGADGMWSSGRPALSEAEPAYTGTCSVDIGFKRAPGRHRASIRAIGDGTLMAVGRAAAC